MSAKIRKTWDKHLVQLRQIVSGFPDRRTGDNTQYSMEDIGLGAFSVFFTQCPSFLAHQKTMQQAKGQSNAQSLFHLEAIPCDNHIRETLDPVPPEKLFPSYDAVFQSLHQAYLSIQRARIAARSIPFQGGLGQLTVEAQAFPVFCEPAL